MASDIESPISLRRMAVLFLLIFGGVTLWQINRTHWSPQQRSALFREQARPGGGYTNDGSAPAVTPAFGTALHSNRSRSGGGLSQQSHNETMKTEVAKSLQTEQTSQSLSFLGLQTVTDADGNLLGLRGTVPLTWRQAGVLDTDLISAIDGVAVQRFVATPAAMVRLANQKNVRLTIMRGTETTTVVVGKRPPTAADRLLQKHTGDR